MSWCKNYIHVYKITDSAGTKTPYIIIISGVIRGWSWSDVPPSGRPIFFRM